MSTARRVYKVLVSHPEVPTPVLDYLRQRGCDIIQCQNVPPVRSEILQKLPGVDAIFWAHHHPLNAEILDAAGSQLKVVSTMFSGIDYVDVPEFKRRQMPLGHTPGIVKNAVADLAIGLMISAGRFFHAGRKEIDSFLLSIDKNMSTARRVYKVLVSHPEVPSPVLDYLRQRGCDIIQCQNVPPVRSEILQKLPGVDAIFWAHYQPLNAEILDAAGSQLKVVSTMSSGIDYVDVPEFKRRQMPLGHTPGIVKNSVADLAIGLMISAGRFFHAGRREIDNSLWKTERINWLMGQEIRDSTIGFFGFGGIGQAIAKRLQCWDTKKIIYHSRTRKENDKDFQAHHVTFEQLLQESDFLVVASPLTNETRGKFNAEAFGRMKPNCVFVNVGRGGIVDQSALYGALKVGQIFAAGLDVMTPEPLPADNPLLTLPNCVIIPHLGTQTWKTTTEMGMVAANNILNTLEGKPMISPAY